MTDNKDFKYVRFSDFDFAQCSQFKEFNCEQEKTPIQARLYFLMLYGRQLRGDKESLYGWTGRIGLSKSTAFGIFTRGNQSMHVSVAQKLAEATGANVEWIQHGVGEPFSAEQQPSAQPEAPVQSEKNDVAKSIDKYLLTQAIETAEKALDIANGTMTPENKAEFISTLYFNTNLNNVSEELLKACVSLIEKALKETRRIMSPQAKSELILVIYNFYSDKPWTQEHLKSALDQLIRSVT